MFIVYLIPNIDTLFFFLHSSRATINCFLVNIILKNQITSIFGNVSLIFLISYTHRAKASPINAVILFYDLFYANIYKITLGMFLSIIRINKYKIFLLSYHWLIFITTQHLSLFDLYNIVPDSIISLKDFFSHCYFKYGDIFF